jgi:hypothetical protein
MAKPPVLDAARAVAAALERAGFDYAIGGAIALAYWGVPRATVDVDVGVSAEPLQLPALFEALRDAGFEIDLDRAAQAAARGDFGCRAHGVRVDVFLPVLPLAREALERRRRVPFGETQIWIVTAEDAALLKLLFGRTKDLADLERLFAVHADRFDYAYMDRWVAALFGEVDPRRRAYAELCAKARGSAG